MKRAASTIATSMNGIFQKLGVALAEPGHEQRHADQTEREARAEDEREVDEGGFY